MSLKKQNEIQDKFSDYKWEFTEIFLSGMFAGAVALLILQNIILEL
tara:strand:+ start:471 stop:608 length:138 start_codon:yes stop_codon:yes gene_type:complete